MGKRLRKPSNGEILDQAPPHNLEVERQTLGSILLDPGRLSEVAGVLQPEHFYADAHARIFRALLAMGNGDGGAIDSSLLVERLRGSGDMEAVGGVDYLAEVAQSVPVAVHAVHYARIIRELADRRRVRHAAQESLVALANGKGAREVCSDLGAEIEGIGDGGDPLPFAKLCTSRDLAGMEVSCDFLVQDTVPVGQVGVVGGRSKVLKTALAADLVVSLGCGVPFLGQFDCEQRPVALWSGESGPPRIKALAQKVAEARGVSLDDSQALWGFELPRLSRGDHLQALQRVIDAHGLALVVVDPAYLCLLDAATAGHAGNVFMMGTLLRGLTEVSQATGCTILLVHHFRKSGERDENEPAALDELSQAGLSEWSRFWLLLARRCPYNGNHQHELWLRTGGSNGFAGLWSVTIDESEWGVEIERVNNPAEEVRRQRDNRKAEDQERKEDEQRDRLREAMETHPAGETERQLCREAGLNGKAFSRAILTLQQRGEAEPCQVKKGNAHYEGFQLVKK